MSYSEKGEKRKSSSNDRNSTHNRPLISNGCPNNSKDKQSDKKDRLLSQ